jgi:hypothetical protein
MILTDGHRNRTDTGPANGKGHGGRVLIANVLPDTEAHHEPSSARCMVCAKPVRPGYVACGGEHSRMVYNGWTAR